jgi:hypothetical protein
MSEGNMPVVQEGNKSEAEGMCCGCTVPQDEEMYYIEEADAAQ